MNIDRTRIMRIGVGVLFSLGLAACGQAPASTAELHAAAATSLSQITPTAAPTETAAPTSTVQPSPTATTQATPTVEAATTAGTAATQANSASNIMATGAEVQAEIKLFMFKPEPIDIQVGTTVVWTNQDNIGHSVTSGTAPTADGKFDSGLFEQSQTFTRTFTEPGEYAYFCSRHPSMIGLIRVQP